jgi:RNA polymerase sigma-70 factor (ECF subfamily)
MALVTNLHFLRHLIVTIDEYNQCVDDFADALYRFARKSVNDSEMAKDFVQDAFEKLWMKLPTVQSGKGKAYLFTTIHNAAIDFHRKEMKKSEHLKISKNSICEIPPIDLKEQMNRAVSLLTEIQRHVILLRDYEGYSYDEIGQITNLTEHQVKVYIFRARQHLKEYIVSVENLL